MLPSVEVGGTFGELLRRNRARAGLSQQALAARAGLSVHAISLLERGMRSAPHNSTVLRLADALRLGGPEREAHFAAARPSHRRATLPPAPHELPLAPADFTGRADELARLLDLLGAAESPVVVTAVDGMGGVGKSALAVQAAHRLAAAGAFPDGQLYLDLQGSSPGHRPLESLDALGHLLRSLGLAPGAIPGEVEEAAARFRSLAAGRRLLVVLDNARSAEQVRPLLPGSPACGVLVTSRQVLATLEGSRALHLDVLPEEQALELLGRVAGAERFAPEPHAAAAIVRCCGGLPLAIRIAGARLASRSGWPVRELAVRLTDAARRLTELEADDLAVRAAFDVSLQALENGADPIDRWAATAFRLVSLPDGPDLGLATAARVLDQPVDDAQTALERLVDARLLESPRAGRYRFHDLVRLHARAEAALRCTEAQRAAALVRCAAFYVATSWRTLALLRPGDWRLENADPRWTVGSLAFDSTAAAIEWLEAERPNLLAAIAQTADLWRNSSLPIPGQLTGQLAQALYGFFFWCSHWADWAWVNETALDVARRSGDRAAEARARTDLGVAFERLRRFPEAIASQEDALAIFRELGDDRGQSFALANLGPSYLWLGRLPEAMACTREILAISRERGDRNGQAISLTNIGLISLRLGQTAEAVAAQRESVVIFRELGNRHGQAVSLSNLGMACGQAGLDAEAIAHLHESLAICRELGYRHGQAESLNNLGVVHRRLERPLDAIACQEESLAIFRELGDRQGLVQVLRDYGDALTAIGRGADAEPAWTEALEIAEDLHVPEADEIRARLTALGV